MSIATRPKSASYQALIDAFPLVPIKSKAELKEAIAMVHSLLRRELDSSEEDYLEVLSQLVEAYEDKQEPIPAPSVSGLLNFLMESKGVSGVEVANRTGLPTSTISEVRTGRRPCSKINCARLAKYFNVSPTIFLEAALRDAEKSSGTTSKTARKVKASSASASA